MTGKTHKIICSIADLIESQKTLLTPEQLAGYISHSRKTIYAKAKAGTIPCVRIGGSIRFDPKATAQWLRERTA